MYVALGGSYLLVLAVAIPAVRTGRRPTEVCHLLLAVG